MALIWISESDQGSFIIGQDLVLDPIILQYLAPNWSTIELVAGFLPQGLNWSAQNGYITIQGTIDVNILTGVFEFTFRLRDDTVDEIADRTFRLEVLTSPVPVWNIPSNLGSYPENYSFNLNPLQLPYDAADGARVLLLNGQLAPGLTWKLGSDAIVITGESNNISQTIQTEFTFRIVNPNGSVADRTFYMTVTPLAVAPSWQGQKQFLGYVASESQASFAVSATMPDNTPLTYSIVGTVPSGLSIDPITGVIRYLSDSLTSDQYVYFTVRASTATAYADREFLIVALTVPHIPMWYNEPGLIQTPQMQYFELDILAFDSSGREITYNIVTADPEFPFLLDPQGLLYGMAPRVQSNRSWAVRIEAVAGSDTNTLDLIIEVTQENTLGVLTWRNSVVEYTGLLDGTTAVYDVGATSTRTNTVKHGITGGQVPPGLVLDKIQGRLVGYIDYHVKPKDYWFDVVATDNVDTLVRTVHMQVSPRLGYPFLNVSLPLQGNARQRWIETNSYMFDDTRMIVNVAVESNQYDFPTMSIIRGLDQAVANPKTIIDQTISSIQTLNLAIGDIEYVTANSQGNLLFYRSVIDPQQNADRTAQHQGDPATIVPASLQNIRDSFLDACSYANAGGGQGAEAYVTVEAETGGITNIFVVAEGSGYNRAPQITIIGPGSGASAHAVCKICSISIIDSGQGWVVGEQIYLKYGKYTRPARLIVSDIGSLGELVQVQILDAGEYQSLPFGKIIIENSAGEISTMSFSLCIDRIVIDSAGTGYYGITTVDFSGSEQLESWQSQWEPYLPIALVNSQTANAVIANSQTVIVKNLDGTIWQTNYLCMEAQGIYHQGSTRFNIDSTTFDGNSTEFEEILSPVQTIFDQNDQTLDQMETVFDQGPPVARDARDNWGLTLIDDGTTAFEFYSTIFDAATPRRESSTLVRRYVRMPRPQISGNNINATSTVPSNK